MLKLQDSCRDFEIEFEQCINLSNQPNADWQISHISKHNSTDKREHTLALSLYNSERESYSQNLLSQTPQLFVLCHRQRNDCRAQLITADKATAAQFMDGKHTLLSHPMPVSIQHWIGCFLQECPQTIMANGNEGFSQ
ncbi:hypothetical protein SIN8267_02883 [Sinobacterium norvegicum]|uniref:Uncharacterized protein n=1 Tax=Sinobacterium norvegicum TaxID=1641715 RepID=A0ABN8EK65_9GAMM|nr:DUF3305 domain-containing protein [Sinobacterium norvegicum]CAH0992747.1 hypothetical protein SIN8267_02883 [Sinobacterium norvegicum]